jgi:splicing factor 45
MSFAPPSFDEAPPPPPADLPDDNTGEDAYARRMRLSQQQGGVPPPSEGPPAPPVPPLSAPSGTISRAPVRYSLPPAPEDIPQSEAELEEALRQESESKEESSEGTPRSLRPGQKGFAERLMNKYGWSKGTGLGANNTGIINPLRVQAEKQKKKPDSEGGGFVGPGGRGKIIGGKKATNETDEHGKFGPMSEVVILRGMLDGMDLDFELGEGNLMQEIGEECGEKVRIYRGYVNGNLIVSQYGRVERVYVDRNQSASVPVFVKFTNQLSALRVSYFMLFLPLSINYRPSMHWKVESLTAIRSQRGFMIAISLMAMYTSEKISILFMDDRSMFNGSGRSSLKPVHYIVV